MVGLLSVVLTVMFWPVLTRHDVTLFNNDGPLGAIASDKARMPGGFYGSWDDLGWLGTPQPSAGPTVTAFVFMLCCGHPIAVVPLCVLVALLVWRKTWNKAM